MISHALLAALALAMLTFAHLAGMGWPRPAHTDLFAQGRVEVLAVHLGSDGVFVWVVENSGVPMAYSADISEQQLTELLTKFSEARETGAKLTLELEHLDEGGRDSGEHLDLRLARPVPPPKD